MEEGRQSREMEQLSVWGSGTGRGSSSNTTQPFGEVRSVSGAITGARAERRRPVAHCWPDESAQQRQTMQG